MITITTLSVPQLLTVVLSVTPPMDKSRYLLLHSTTRLPIPAKVASLSMVLILGVVRLVECGVIQSQPVKVSKYHILLSMYMQILTTEQFVFGCLVAT